MNATGFAVLDELTSVARSYHSTPAAVALAWLAQQPTITSALASVTSREQLDSLVAAGRLQLAQQDIERLSSIGGRISNPA
jgi:aryl-alcohol dehydrogenase-like predicted oxidoreductase